jgi:predicted RNase H-like HicB family nuclease
MLTACYEIGEDGECHGEIPGFNGVCAHAEGLEACREALQNVLEDWLLRARQPPHLAA